MSGTSSPRPGEHQRAVALALGWLALAVNPAAQAADEASQADTITVTGTREATPLSESPAAVGVIKNSAIRRAAPSHPQQLLGQIPGVSINVTNGEGHTTGIRQKIGTDPVYLYLEDGIPVRATGFFNHNALYEINLPQAGGVEVVKGIGSALYGSDAIGGTINILTNPPARQAGAALSAEYGSHGWYRLLGSADTGRQTMGALRADLNVSHTDGWREHTAYERQSVNLRWDHAPDGDTALKTILGYARIDQQTGANSALTPFEYENTPTVNARSVAYRKVEALRLSSNLDKDLGDNGLVSITPYFRHNYMDLNGAYNFSTAASGDPRIEKTDVSSLGFLLKWRKDFPGALRPRLIAGLDYDYSPGKRSEDALDFTGCNVAGTATSAQKFTCYALGPRIYDYAVTYQSASPYLHFEVSPLEALRLTAAVRYDTMSYKASNNLAAGDMVYGTRHYWQNAGATLTFSRASPKLGANLALNPATHVYASYNQGFRAPGEGNLFRAGHDTTLALGRTKATDALQLKPIEAEQYELGLRGDGGGWQYDVTAYSLRKDNDILSQRDALNQTTISTNNGSTRHQGVELGLGKAFGPQWRLDVAYSYARHTYETWITNQFAGANLNGKEIESAPRQLGNVRLTWTPVAATTAQVEWVKTGSYWLDAANTGKYAGHELWNLRASHELSKGMSLSARVINLADKRYADSAGGTAAAPTLSPGLPRTVFAGVEAKW